MKILFYFIWIFLQVETKEDDLETDFFKDLIPLQKNKDVRGLALALQKSNHASIFHSSSRSYSSTQNSAFQQAIEASHKKVIKMVPDHFILFWKLIPIPVVMQQEGKSFDVRSGFLIHI